MRRIVLIAVLVLATGGCGSNDDAHSTGSSDSTYSTDETKDAFDHQGYSLASLSPDLQYILQASAGAQPFTVYVFSDAEVDKSWPEYEKRARRHPDTFTARRANVLVAADGPLGVHRERVTAALASLPDRDQPVMVAG